jgi:uncharacterized lipoprotein YmbA
MISYIRLLFFCGVLMLMSGCIGSTTKPSSFFFLSATEANRSENIIRRDGPAIRLGMFAFPDYLSRPSVVTRSTENVIIFDEFQRWAGSLENDFHRTLGSNLSTLLGSENISVYPADAVSSARYQVAGQIISFDGYLGQKVILDVHWFVVNVADNKTYGSMHSVIVEPVAGEDYAAFVAAQSRAVGRLSGAIADEVKHLVANDQK